MAEFRPNFARPGTFLVRLLMLIALSFAAGIQPAAAQSILRDSETEALLRDMSRPIVAQPGALSLPARAAELSTGNVP